MGMQQSDFIAHLDRKGVLRDGKVADSGPEQIDGLGVCRRARRVLPMRLGAATRPFGAPVAGAELSPRFLREEQLFPYKHSFGTVAGHRSTDRRRHDTCRRNCAAAVGSDRCRDRFIAGPRAIGPAWSPLISRGCRRVTVKFCVPAIELRPRDVLARRPFVFFGTLRLPELWWPSR